MVQLSTKYSLGSILEDDLMSSKSNLLSIDELLQDQHITSPMLDLQIVSFTDSSGAKFNYNK